MRNLTDAEPEAQIAALWTKRGLCVEGMLADRQATIIKISTDIETGRLQIYAHARGPARWRLFAARPWCSQLRQLIAQVIDIVDTRLAFV